MADTAERYADLSEKAERVIREIKTQRYREVLNCRYILDLSWRSTADEMDYSNVQSAYRVHGWALAAAQRVMDKMSDM